jgi:hypothetical protein
MDFNVLKAANISQSLFAKMVPATPVTVNHWVKGKNIRKGMQDRVTKLLNAITAGVANGSLPSKAYTKDERVVAITKIVNEHLQAMTTPAQAEVATTHVDSTPLMTQLEIDQRVAQEYSQQK